jgi:hypothetical protein
MKTWVHLWYFTEFFLEREMFQAAFVEKIKTQILLLVSFSTNRAFYEITWWYMVEPDRPQITIKCGAENMRFACWITEAIVQTRTVKCVWYLLLLTTLWNLLHLSNFAIGIHFCISIAKLNSSTLLVPTSVSTIIKMESIVPFTWLQ